MQLGFGAPVSGSWATPANQVEIAQRAEELGYVSLWTFSRLIFSDWPEGQRLTPPYRSVHDPLVISAFLAGATKRIRLGLAVVNLPFYAPIVLAKALNSIDIVSDGRLDAGLGLGWSPDEFEAAGADMARRGARAVDYLKCLDAIWSGDAGSGAPIEYHGEFYDVPRGWVDPKPVQKPHPPVLLGGSADAALRRAGAIAEGWISSSRAEIDRMPYFVEQVRRGAEQAGKDPDAARIVIRGVAKLRDTDDPANPLTGTADHIRRGLQIYAESGATELFLDLNFDDQIGSPDADPARSMQTAHRILEEFAPAGE
jgi:probable F420-dependent oxidoreductase